MTQFQPTVPAKNSFFNDKSDKIIEQEKIGKLLIQESSGQQEIAENFLRAHIKKFTERINHLQVQKQRLELWEKLQILRKIKMLCEICSVFSTESVLDGFKLVGTNWPSEKDAEITTALGYACLILHCLSLYCNFRLQYPVRFQGSRSSIYSCDREYQLYTVGKTAERVKMDQGVRYLVQDLRQAVKWLGCTGDVDSGMLLETLVEGLSRYRGV